MRKILILVIIICSNILQGQNLVPNPSFEEFDHCPIGVPDLNGNLKDWLSFRGTPDYFNKCSTIEGIYNSWGYQLPHTGLGYADVGVYQSGLPNSQEQIGV